MYFNHTKKSIFRLFFFFFPFSLGTSDPTGLGERKGFGHLVARDNHPEWSLFQHPQMPL